MVSLLRKLIRDSEDRMFFTGMIVVAANAGGAWSPIGDITTTMLWIGGQITASNIVIKLFLPSLVCLTVPLIYLSFRIKGRVTRPEEELTSTTNFLSASHQMTVFLLGILVLVLVPVFKTATHLPPFMGILIGLGILWMITEVLHEKKAIEDKNSLSVVSALQKIDTPSILFFLGILMSIAALQSSWITS